MKKLTLLCLLTVAATSCKTSSNYKLKDIEARDAGSGKSMAIYQDGGKVYVKGCKEDATKGADGFYSRQ